MNIYGKIISGFFLLPKNKMSFHFYIALQLVRKEKKIKSYKGLLNDSLKENILLTSQYKYAFPI